MNAGRTGRPAPSSSDGSCLPPRRPACRAPAGSGELSRARSLGCHSQIPGLNAPGLVPAKKVPKQAKPEWEDIRDAGTNHFWSPKGIMNSVPKMKGIITPKSAIPGGLE